MKQLFLFLSIVCNFYYGEAQQAGMQFEHNSSWEKVLAKAKAENKYIFVDCYTTWCGPCKMMSANVFPTQEVGDFFNKNFINVKVQLDTTANDNEEVKSWFATGDMLEEKYSVRAYPTYLFFDPNGTIVDRSVGATEAKYFIAKGQDALNPEKQYYAIKHLYENGRRDTAFLLQMAKAATQNYDAPFSKTVTDEYLATQTDLLKPENARFLAENIAYISSSKDLGFKELLAHPEIFDSLTAPGYTLNQTRMIILKEEAMPYLFPKGQKESVNPDWAGALKLVKAKYPTLADEAISYYKVVHYQGKQDWKNFGPAVSVYMKSYNKNATEMQVNDFAWAIFQNCDNVACVNSTLDWGKNALTLSNQAAFMDTYANLLYKSGKKKEAIEWETKALSLAKKTNEDITDYQAALTKMGKGEKTW